MKLKLFLFVFAAVSFAVSNSFAGVQGPSSEASASPRKFVQSRAQNTRLQQETAETAATDEKVAENDDNPIVRRLAYEKNSALLIDPDNLKCGSDGNGMLYCLDDKNKPFTGKKNVQLNENRFKSVENFRNGYLDGLCTYFDDRGQRAERAYYKEGIKHGMYKLYYSDNHIKVLANYKDGLLDGMADVYLEDSTLWGRMKYKKGYLEKGYCKKNGKKENFSNEYIKSYPYNTINSCGIPL